MKYDCIIFDCDGVLVDSEDISNQILVDMANGLGAQIDYQFAKETFVGKSLSSIFTYLEETIHRKLPESFEKEFRERTFELFKTDLKPIEGIHALLDQLNVPICVASSGPKDKIKLNLETTGLLDKFQNRIYSSYEIDSWKPSPKLFLHAAQQMGFEPNQCAVVEDSPVGVEAGKNGGFDVFAFTKPNYRSSFESQGARVFFNMNELLALLNE